MSFDFVSFIRTGMWKDFSSQGIAFKVDVIGQKIDCLEARQCIFQPGKCYRLGSEGVNNILVGQNQVISQ